ncbi:MAG TPA: tripartite tricarboxylate transporter substrate-binding protein [Beijerinckiaceae bacterium]
MTSRRFAGAISVAMTLGCALAPTAQAQEAAFYKDKVVSLMVGFPPGGGYDSYARVVSRHMSRHMPGEPRIIVQNMPGAGSLNLANHIYSAAPKDGTVIGSIEAGIPFEYYYEGKGVRFDPTKFTWIGGLNREVTTCQVWSASPIQTFKDLFAREGNFGGTGSGAPPIVEANVLREVLGAKIKLIPGYPGLPDIYGAMERQELDGACGVNWSSIISVRPQWVAEKKVRTLVQIAAARHPDLPDAPLVTDFARSPEERQILELLVLPNEIGRPYVAPPDVPPARARALREAFAATLRDEAFLAEAKRANLPIDPVASGTIEDAMRRAAALPPDVVKRMARARM